MGRNYPRDNEASGGHKFSHVFCTENRQTSSTIATEPPATSAKPVPNHRAANRREEPACIYSQPTSMALQGECLMPQFDDQ